MEEREILALLFARDERAIRALDLQYGRLCHSIAENILGNASDAEECVNDAFLGVWNTVPPKCPEALLPYVCRLVKNIALARYRNNTALKRRSNYAAALDELSAALASPDTPERVCEATELRDAIQRWLDRQPESDRALFIRRYWYAEPVSALAAQLHISENNASVRLHRLRERLKKQLLKEGLL